MLLELDALQKSSGKLREERIFELKQQMEDMSREGDLLSSEAKTLKREIKTLRCVLC